MTATSCFRRLPYPISCSPVNVRIFHGRYKWNYLWPQTNKNFCISLNQLTSRQLRPHFVDQPIRYRFFTHPSATLIWPPFCPTNKACCTYGMDVIFKSLHRFYIKCMIITVRSLFKIVGAIHTL